MKPVELESSNDYQEATESYLALMTSNSMAPGDIVGEPEPLPRVSWWVRDVAIGIAGGLLAGFLAYRLFAPGVASPPRPAEEGASGSATEASHEIAKTAAPAAEPAPGFANEGQPGEAGAKTAEEEGAGDRSPAADVASVDGHRKSLLPEERRVHFLRLIARGWKFYETRNFLAASNVFGRAVREEPKKIDGYYGLALALFEQGQDDAACRVLERGARAIGKKSELWLLGGSIYQVLGDEAKARDAYQRYLRDNPRGAYAKDIRALLSLESLPRLKPEDLPQMEEKDEK